MVEFDPTVLVFVLGSIVTSIGGFVVIWNVIRLSKRDTKEDLEKSSRELEGRIKDHINYKVELLDNKVDNVENKVNGMSDDIKKKKRPTNGSLNHLGIGYEILREKFQAELGIIETEPSGRRIITVET